MKLLITTQKVDKNDSNLGFFHRWIEEFAKHCEKVTVICLEKGEFDLPENVEVFSLGKEEIRNWKFEIQVKLLYLYRFYKYILKCRKDYDHVFVHMNPEYVILGGLFWRLQGKKILLWYTHKAVNLKLRLAEKLATKIFTASKESFRLKSKKVEIVGHGIDVDLFTSDIKTSLADDAINLLTVGRISSVKDLETIILACNELIKMQAEKKINLNIIGKSITKQDFGYKKVLEELVDKLGLSKNIKFVGSRRHQDMAREYQNHHVLIHTSQTGSVDKVVLEALAAGLAVFTSSEAYEKAKDYVIKFPKNDFKSLAASLEKELLTGIIGHNQKAQQFVKENFSLGKVIDKIIGYFKI